MKLPTGLRIKGVNQNSHCLQQLKNIYVHKQEGRVRNQYLVQGLLNIGCKQSYIYECVFYRSDVIFSLYVDYGRFLRPSLASVEMSYLYGPKWG